MSADQEKYGPKKGLLPRLLNDMTLDEICIEIQKANPKFNATKDVGTTNSINIIYEDRLYVLYYYRYVRELKWGVTRTIGKSYRLVKIDIKTFEEFLNTINKNIINEN